VTNTEESRYGYGNPRGENHLFLNSRDWGVPCPVGSPARLDDCYDGLRREPLVLEAQPERHSRQTNWREVARIPPGSAPGWWSGGGCVSGRAAGGSVLSSGQRSPGGGQRGKRSAGYWAGEEPLKSPPAVSSDPPSAMHQVRKTQRRVHSWEMAWRMTLRCVLALNTPRTRERPPKLPNLRRGPSQECVLTIFRGPRFVFERNQPEMATPHPPICIWALILQLTMAGSRRPEEAPMPTSGGTNRPSWAYTASSSSSAREHASRPWKRAFVVGVAAVVCCFTPGAESEHAACYIAVHCCSAALLSL